MSGESAPADNGGAVESLAEIMGDLAEYDPDGECTTAAARYKALGVLERANQSAARPQPESAKNEASGETFCPDCGGDGYTIEQVGTYPDGGSEPGQRMCERCEGKGFVPISHLVYRAMDKDIIFEVLKEYGAMIQTIERQYGKPYDRTKLNNALAIVYTEDRLASARSSSAEVGLREALTPSEGTKAAYIGEFSISFPDIDEEGQEVRRKINVPWTTVKEIMAAILARAALGQSEAQP